MGQNAHALVRGALFYGPGTGHDDAWRSAARAGKLTMPDDGTSFISLIHVADMADAVVKALNGPTTATLAVVDDKPVCYSELFHYVAALERSQPQKSGAASILASFRVPNHAVKCALGWEPRYPSFLSGLA
jgi:nucleoside-diphosphate-sugar epimerase